MYYNIKEKEMFMKAYDFIETKSLLITLAIRFFSNKYIYIVFDIVITTLIAMHTENINIESQEWWKILCIYILAFIVYNFLYLWMDYLGSKRDKVHKFVAHSYEVQNKLNHETATRLYRVNKKINGVVKEKRIEKGEISEIANFQELSFRVCNGIHDFIIQKCECDECEVTIFQRFSESEKKDYVRMIAYRNTKNIVPSTYETKYSLKVRKGVDMPVFVSIFNDLNAETKIIENSKKIKKEFITLEGSESREEKICQYIGIPIKTDRGKIELVLQIDVSKEKVFGSSYNAVKQFADNVFEPFVSLLHCSYERDIALNKFYNILEENIKKST